MRDNDVTRYKLIHAFRKNGVVFFLSISYMRINMHRYVNVYNFDMHFIGKSNQLPFSILDDSDWSLPLHNNNNNDHILQSIIMVYENTRIQSTFLITSRAFHMHVDRVFQSLIHLFIHIYRYFICVICI